MLKIYFGTSGAASFCCSGWQDGSLPHMEMASWKHGPHGKLEACVTWQARSMRYMASWKLTPRGVSFQLADDQGPRTLFHLAITLITRGT